MGTLGYFRPVKGISAQEVHALIHDREPKTYNLLDVRQPNEYSHAHLPGAQLIPLSELSARATEINKSLPTIVYCRSGNRSRAASELLVTLGFGDVSNMSGGINAYLGHVAFGPPEGGMAVFPPETPAAELAAIAWLLEDGTARFYAHALGMYPGSEAARLFESLMATEDGHKAMLAMLYTELSGDDVGPEFPRGLLKVEGDFIEGGIPLADVVAWAEGKQPSEVIEQMMAFECNAFDLYVRMGRTVSSEEARRVFETLSHEERGHLARLSDALDTIHRGARAG